MVRHAKMQAKCLILPNPEHTPEGRLHPCCVKCFQSRSTDAHTHCCRFHTQGSFPFEKRVHQDAKVVTIFLNHSCSIGPGSLPESKTWSSQLGHVDNVPPPSISQSGSSQELQRNPRVSNKDFKSKGSLFLLLLLSEMDSLDMNLAIFNEKRELWLEFR